MRVKLDLVAVECFDLHTVGGWQSKEEVAKMLRVGGVHQVSIGFLIRDDDKAIVLAATASADEKQEVHERYGDFMVLPRGCVKRVTHIRPKGLMSRFKKFLDW